VHHSRFRPKCQGTINFDVKKLKARIVGETEGLLTKGQGIGESQRISAVGGRFGCQGAKRPIPGPQQRVQGNLGIARNRATTEEIVAAKALTSSQRQFEGKFLAPQAGHISKPRMENLRRVTFSRVLTRTRFGKSFVWFGVSSGGKECRLALIRRHAV
jgi:hypothetical protein